ncbi:MAG: hypothetical protein RLZZ374_21 [Cyanobacteriota bacterium]
MQGHRQTHGQNTGMGSHHQGNRHFGQGEGLGHGGQLAMSSHPLFAPGANPATALALAVTALDPQGPARQRWTHALGLLALFPDPVSPGPVSSLPVPPGPLPPGLGKAETVVVSAEQVRQLDLSVLKPWLELAPAELLERSGQLSLSFSWPQAAEDPREPSEIAELRLWSLRADAHYPWMTLLLERSSGQLCRHVAMQIPHSFSRSEGIRFAPASLELWITHRLFVLEAWGRSQGLTCRGQLTAMATVLGYELDPHFWTALD